MLIDELTPLQEQRLMAKRDHWLGRARSTAPLDERAATLAIRAVYTLIGKPAPQIVFCSSPMACLLAWGLLRASGSRYAASLSPLKHTIVSQIPEVLRRQAARQFPEELSNVRLARLRAQIEGRLHLLLRERLMNPVLHQTAEGIAQQGGFEPLLAEVWSQLNSQLSGGRVARPRKRMSTLAVSAMLRQLQGLIGGPCECLPEVLQDCCVYLGASLAKGQVLRLLTWLVQGRHCHFWLPCPNLVLASDKPCQLSVDSQGCLHDEHRAALEYRDGYALYAWHGRRVAPWIITDPGTISVERIEAERNAQVHCVMIERYGCRRYMLDCNAPVVDSVPLEHPIVGLRGARLLRKDLPGGADPLVYLEMVNSTPEPDGTYRRFLERIDPNAYGGAAGRLCHAAMASRWKYLDERGRLRPTFERWEDYRPSAES